MVDTHADQARSASSATATASRALALEAGPRHGRRQFDERACRPRRRYSVRGGDVAFRELAGRPPRTSSWSNTGKEGKRELNARDVSRPPCQIANVAEEPEGVVSADLVHQRLVEAGE